MHLYKEIACTWQLWEGAIFCDKEMMSKFDIVNSRLKHPYLLSFLLLLGFLSSSAQSTNDPALLLKNRGAFGYINTFSLDPEIDGYYLLDEKSFPMTLHLAPTRDPFRVEGGNINLLDYSVLLDFEGSVYTVQPIFVDSVFLKGRWLVNSRYLPGDLEPNQLLYVLNRGPKLTLLKEQRMDLLPPTWNKALQVGNKKKTVQMKVKYYCIDEEGNRYDVTKNIGDFKEEPSYSQLRKFYKGQKLDFKDEADIMRFAKYADTVVEK